MVIFANIRLFANSFLVLVLVTAVLLDKVWLVPRLVNDGAMPIMGVVVSAAARQLQWYEHWYS